MKSPFPGMDPYIEGCCWGDFHSVFIQCWREAVLDQLPDGFDAEITEYAWSLHRELPVIPVPLIEPYADVRVDISRVFATAFERGRYHRRLKYKDPPVAPVRPELADWVRKVADVGARP